jgi:hypothetical protein
MDIIELSYRTPIPEIKVGLYARVYDEYIGDDDYIEVSGGGYSRQRYTGKPLVYGPATSDWGTVDYVGLFWKNKSKFVSLEKGSALNEGDTFTLDLNLQIEGR